jgi:hypothetical protein
MTTASAIIISEINTTLAPAGGYVDLDPLSVDMPGQPSRAQAISIEGGSVAIVDCETSEDCYWVPLAELQFWDLFELIKVVRWCKANNGIEVQS